MNRILLIRHIITRLHLPGLLILIIFSAEASLHAQYYYSHQEFCMGADLSYVNHIRISYPEDITCLKIYDLNGRLVYQFPVLAEGTSRIETGSWGPGVYLLSFSGWNISVSAKKVAIYH